MSEPFILFSSFQTYVGPILLSINPYNDVGNPITLNSTRDAAREAEDFYRVAQEAIRVQGETGYSQAIILSGGCGSGKTYASMVLLRQLFDIAGGGPETDAFKHVAAAFSVLRSLGSAKTAANRESSRIVRRERERGDVLTLVSAGSLHRGPGQRRGSLQDEALLLQPGPEQGGQASSHGEELSHFLPGENNPPS